MTTISLDLEATGLDIYHGSAKPFLVTTMTEKEELTFWEWDVDPITREPEIPKKDLLEIRDVIQDADELVLQNGIYDGSVLIWYFDYRGIPFYWDWSKVKDTLYAGHLLASNEPHDLTTLGIRYLGYNIEKYEKDLEVAVKHCRNLTRNREFIERNGEWKIAKAGYPDMPSIKEKSWQADFWLPRAVAKAEGSKNLGDEKYIDYQTVTSSYANVDSSVTLPIWKVQEQEIKERDLWEIYLERLKLLPIVFDMQSRGVTINQRRAQELVEGFREDSEHSGAICKTIAESYGYELHLPKSGNNKSLTEFIPKIVPKEVYNRMPLTEGNHPSLNKTALEFLTESLPPRSKALTFFQELRAKRKKDTGISYLEGYERFWQSYEEDGDDWKLLHPRLNVTGTATLRWSSSSPNEQNISKQEESNLRYTFGPPPGKEWWSLDYSNLELTIPAYESGERAIIDLLEKPGDPPYFGSFHLLIFSVLHPDKWNRKDPEGLLKAKEKYSSTWYQYTKNGNFALIYGAVEESGTADRAYHVPGAHNRIKERFRNLEAHNQAMIRHAERFGYVETIPDRTVNPKRGYPLLCTRTKWGRILPTVPLNYRTQGTAMWVTAKAQVRVFDYLNRGDIQLIVPGGRIVLQVHDELVVELPAKGKKNLPIVETLKGLMAKSGDDIGIPLRVSASYHPNNWKEKEKL